MSVAETIAPHIPYLRRYARVLTGNQTSGDAYVASILEAMIQEKLGLSSEHAPRVALYRAFTEYWQSLSVNLTGEMPAREQDQKRIDVRLEQITPMARQAFLLTTVEDFTPEEAAQVLRLNDAELSTLLDQAGAEIAHQVVTDVLIIEDEPIIAMDLENLVKTLGHGVTGIARTHSEALDVIVSRHPGLVLADIQLADGSSGIDAVNDILDKIDLPVVFITAYPERLLTGSKPEPAFLITKPFHPETVKAVISQALFFDVTAGSKAEPTEA